MKKKTVTIIPARGGSKGIPKKNLTSLCGNPLIYYSVKASIDCKKIDETWVSSDDDDIIRYCRSLGAKTIKRPDYLCTDTASSESAIEHFCNEVDFKTMVFVQATSPLITSKILTSAIESHFSDDSVDSTVAGFLDHGFWWDEKGPCFDPLNRPTRQKQGLLYKESGMFYITSREGFLQSGCRYSGSAKIFEVDRMSSLEVDSIEDLKLIELIMRNKNV
ncbi:acylneuraminate cytidylyltransferase family protein [bacterium]|nr:acylneuraminate cytidylyltransferase family protein [bacterium]